MATRTPTDTRRNHATVSWSLLIGLVAVGAALGMAVGSVAPLWASGIGVTLVLIRLRTGRLLTPVVLPICVLAVAAYAGWWSNARPGLRPGVSYNEFLSGSVSLRTLSLMCFAAIMLGVGSLLTLPGARYSSPDTPDRYSLRIPEMWLRRLSAASWVPTLTIIFTVGPGTLIKRQTYLAGSQGGLFGIGLSLSLASVVVAGYVCAASKGTRRATAFVSAAVALLIFFSLGSRRMALWPALFFAGYWLQKQTRRTLAIFVVATLVSVYLIRVPLYLRGGAAHGLLPYAHELLTALWYSQSGNPAVNNVVAGYSITGVTAYLQPSIPLRTLFIDLNPLPGRLAGFYTVATDLRLNAATPYSAIGELGNYGLFVTGIVMSTTGALLGYFERRIRFYAECARQFMGVTYFGIFALFSVQMLQYNLRSDWRLPVYALVLDVVIVIFPNLIGISGDRDLHAPNHARVRQSE